MDFVVPKGKTKTARTLLKEAKTCFAVENRTNHTTYLSDPRVHIEILTPPALFKEDFSHSTPTILVNGNRILKPTLILNGKCASILGRGTEFKKTTDATDIKFLLRWCAAERMYPTASEVPHATREFVEYFIATYGSPDL